MKKTILFAALAAAIAFPAFFALAAAGTVNFVGNILDKACEVDGSALIARRKAPEVLETVEAPLDTVAVSVGHNIVRDDDLAGSG